MSVLARVGPYDILDRRPEGTSVLCLARHSSDDRPVLVRLLSIADAGVATRERLVGELEALALVQHRNLVTVVDVVDDESGLGLVTEVLEGTTLDEVASARPLGVRAMLDVGAQVCAGLHFGHALGLSHGRLRADQVCITPDGTAKVLNVGLALIDLVAGPGRTETDVDRASDDWRLADLRGVGAILYQGLTGREPSPRSVRTTLDRDRVSVFGDASATVADELAGLIELLLDQKKDPTSTCADAGALGRMLTAARLALDEPPVEATASSTEQMATILMEPTIEQPAPALDAALDAPAVKARTWPLGPPPNGVAPGPERGTAVPSPVVPPARPSAPKPPPSPAQPARVAEAPPIATRGAPVLPARKGNAGRAERTPPMPPVVAPRLGPIELGTMLAPLPATPLAPPAPERRTRDVAVWGSIGIIALAAAGLAFWLLPGAAPRPASGLSTTTTTSPAGTWTLSLDSDPQGAAIAIDGTPRPEVTPVDLALPRSPYPTIELTLDGFRAARVPVSDTVRLNGRVRVRLEPVPPPASARKVPVVVNGSFPFEIVQGGRVISTAASEHAIDVRTGDVITVRAAAFYLDRSFLVPPEGLHVTLPAVARVAFEANAAEGCAIAIGNTITDSAPGGEPLLVPLGAYQFSLRCRDGRPRIRTAEVLDVPLNRVTFPSTP